MAASCWRGWVMAVAMAVVIAGGVSATSNGAGSCMNTADDLAFFIEHHGEALSTGTGDTSVVLSADTIAPGCVYTVTICSTAAFNGFMLDVKDMNSPYARVGSFADPSASGTAKLQACTYANSAVTHSVPTQRNLQTFTWTAPTATYEAVHFRLFTVRQSPNDWYQIEKMVMMADTGAACPAVPSSNTCPGAGESLVPDTMDMSHMSMSMDMVMNTKFQTGKWSGINIVFPSWVLNTTLSYVCTLIAIALISFFAEWLQMISMRVDRHFALENIGRQAAHVIAAQKQPTTPHSLAVGQSALKLTVNTQSGPENIFSPPLTFTHPQQLMRSLLHVLRTFIGLFLMIVFMTLDVGLCVMTLLGYGVGFFMFARGQPVAPDTASTACH